MTQTVNQFIIYGPGYEHKDCLAAVITSLSPLIVSKFVSLLMTLTPLNI